MPPPPNQTMPFISGFTAFELPFIRCPMMRPFRVSARCDNNTNTLIISNDYKWGSSDIDQRTQSDETEFHPATDVEQQLAFLKELTKRITKYYEQLAICCERRGTCESDDDIGFYNTYQ